MKIRYNGNEYSPTQFRMLLQVIGNDAGISTFDKFMFVCSAFNWDFDLDGNSLGQNDSLFKHVSDMYENLMGVDDQ